MFGRRRWPLYPHNISLSLFPDVAAEFYAIGELEVLSVLSGALVVSDYVQMHLQDGGINISVPTVVEINGDDLEIFDQTRQTYPGLGIADVGALAVALKSNAGTLTNDVVVRDVGCSLGLHPWGTLRLLEYAVAIGVLVAIQAFAIFEKLAAVAIWLNRELRAAFQNRIHKAAALAASRSYSPLPVGY
jgi:predicted nucleic acid-binding protein